MENRKHSCTSFHRSECIVKYNKLIDDAEIRIKENEIQLDSIKEDITQNKERSKQVSLVALVCCIIGWIGLMAGQQYLSLMFLVTMIVLMLGSTIADNSENFRIKRDIENKLSIDNEAKLHYNQILNDLGDLENDED